MRLTTMPHVNVEIEALLADGWSVWRHTKHLVLSPPDQRASLVTIQRTAPDKGRRVQNILAELRRQRRKYE